MDELHKADVNTDTNSTPGMSNKRHQAPETLINELSEMEIQRALRKKFSMAKKLAGNAPKAHRKEMETLFTIGLYVQQRFEVSHRLQSCDINGALAIFLYGIWSINNQGGRISGEAFTQLIASTHEVLTNWGGFLKEYEKSPQGKRQSLYETFAMVGNWLLMIQHHLNAQPDDTALDNVKIMVREIIIHSLKIEPESIRIDQDGNLTLVPTNQPHEIIA